MPATVREMILAEIVGLEALLPHGVLPCKIRRSDRRLHSWTDEETCRYCGKCRDEVAAKRVPERIVAELEYRIDRLTAIYNDIDETAKEMENERNSNNRQQTSGNTAANADASAPGPKHGKRKGRDAASGGAGVRRSANGTTQTEKRGRRKESNT